jgi:hypothetical protein
MVDMLATIAPRVTGLAKFLKDFMIITIGQGMTQSHANSVVVAGSTTVRIVFRAMAKATSLRVSAITMTGRIMKW